MQPNASMSRYNGLPLPQRLYRYLAAIDVNFPPVSVDNREQGGISKNAYELLNLRALKKSMLYENGIFQCMGKIFYVEFQRVPLKFHTKYLTHKLKDVDFVHRWKFKSS